MNLKSYINLVLKYKPYFPTSRPINYFTKMNFINITLRNFQYYLLHTKKSILIIATKKNLLKIKFAPTKFNKFFGN